MVHDHKNCLFFSLILNKSNHIDLNIAPDQDLLIIEEYLHGKLVFFLNLEEKMKVNFLSKIISVCMK